MVWLDADKLGHYGNGIGEEFGAVLVEKFGKKWSKMTFLGESGNFEGEDVLNYHVAK